MIDYISPFAVDFPAVPPVKGVRLAAACTGMKYEKRNDIMLVELTENTTVAGVFTRNSMCGAPINWCKSILERGTARALVVNAGIANVFAGKQGTDVVEATAEATAKMLGCEQDEVYIAATGVIGEQVDKDKLLATLPTLRHKLSTENWGDAARAIMTTDTFAKGLSYKAFIGGTEVTINGFIKGSGMINPDMATMLGYVFTDAKIPASVLQDMLSEDTEIAYNCITVDSDTSTSDMVLAFATGQAEHWEITDKDAPELTDFREKFQKMHVELAKLVVKDGEGLTKFVTIHVKGAESFESARKIGLSIGNSPLVKCALAGEDPNWGRIIAAAGKTLEPMDRDKSSVWIGDQLIAEHGTLAAGYDEDAAKTAMQQKEFTITLDVGVGDAEATTWTIDLTHDYININVDYRS